MSHLGTLPPFHDEKVFFFSLDNGDAIFIIGKNYSLPLLGIM